MARTPQTIRKAREEVRQKVIQKKVVRSPNNITNTKVRKTKKKKK